jgi:hypothetical protein
MKLHALLLAAVVAATGCTAIPNLPRASGPTANGSASSGQSSAQRLSSKNAALLSKKSLSTLKNVVANLKFTDNSSRKKPVGKKDSSIRVQSFRVQDLATDSADPTATDSVDPIADNTYDQIQWFWTEIASDSHDNFYSSTTLEEGRVKASDGTVKVVERYQSKADYTVNVASSSDQVEVGTYERKDQVLLSEYRRLGTYDVKGSYTNYASGQNLINATQTFTSQDGKTTATVQISSSQINNVNTYKLTGGLAGGGSIDLTYTNIDNTTAQQDASGSFQPWNGNYTATQKGTLVTPDGLAVLVDISDVTTYVNGRWTEAGTTNLTLKDYLVLTFSSTYDGTNYNVAGQMYLTDIVHTKIGDIAVDQSNWDGTVTFSDGSTDSIKLQPIFDIINASHDT